MRKNQRSEAQILTYITNWRKSGLSKPQYCRQNQIPYQTFHNWLKKNGTTENKNNRPTDFIQLSPPEITELPTMMISLPNGIEIRLNPTDAFPLLQNLINLIQ